VIHWEAERAAPPRHFLAGNGNSQNAREGLHICNTSETPATSRGLRFPAGDALGLRGFAPCAHGNQLAPVQMIAVCPHPLDGTHSNVGPPGGRDPRAAARMSGDGVAEIRTS